MALALKSIFTLPQHLNSGRPTAQCHYGPSDPCLGKVSHPARQPPSRQRTTHFLFPSLSHWEPTSFFIFHFCRSALSPSGLELQTGHTAILSAVPGPFQRMLTRRFPVKTSPLELACLTWDRTDTFLLTLYLFGEFYPMRISQRSWLFINIMNVKNFTHKLNYRLCFVEGSGRN